MSSRQRSSSARPVATSSNASGANAAIRKPWELDIDWKERFHVANQDLVNLKKTQQAKEKELIGLKRMMAKLAPNALAQWQLAPQPSSPPQQHHKPTKQSAMATPKTPLRGVLKRSNTPSREPPPAPPPRPPSPPPVTVTTTSKTVQQVLGNLANRTQKQPPTRSVATSPKSTTPTNSGRHTSSHRVVRPTPPLLVRSWSEAMPNASALLPTASATAPSSVNNSLEVTYVPTALAWGSEDVNFAEQHRVGNDPSETGVLVATVRSLQSKLAEAESMLCTLRDELAHTRDHLNRTHAHLEDARSERNHVIMERDVLAQTLEARDVAYRSVIEDRDAVAQERARVTHEYTHALDLRRAHELDAKRTEMHLVEQVRCLSESLKQKSAELNAQSIRTASAETAAASLRDTNDAMLLEMRTLQNQLSTERKMVIALTQDAQKALGVEESVAEMRRQLTAAQEECKRLTDARLSTLTRHAEIMAEEEARLRGEYESRAKELEDANTEWERVARVQFQEMQQLSKQHTKMKSDLDAARAMRDVLEVDLDAARKSLELMSAKMRVLCPHADDVCDVETQDLRAALAWVYQQKKKHAHLDASELVMMATSAPSETDAALVDALERTKKVVALLNDRLETVQKQTHKTEQELRAELETSRARHVQTEDERRRRVMDLESLVADLRHQLGRQVDNNTSVLDLCAGSEVIFEVFVGRMDIGVSHRWHAENPRFVVSLDFLVHETSVSDVVFGWSPSFDAAFSYRCDLDDTLMYYLCTRTMRVTLHRVFEDGQEEAYAFADVPLLDIVDSQRHVVHGVYTLNRVSSSSPTSIGGIDVQVHVRGSLTADFLALRDLMVPTATAVTTTDASGGNVRDSLVLGVRQTTLRAALRALRNVAALRLTIHHLTFVSATPPWPLLTVHYSYHTLQDVMCSPGGSSSSSSSVLLFDDTRTITFSAQHGVTESVLHAIATESLRILLWSSDSEEAPWGVACISPGSDLLREDRVEDSVGVFRPTTSNDDEDGAPPVAVAHLKVSLEWVPPPSSMNCSTTMVNPMLVGGADSHDVSLDAEYSVLELNM